MISRLDAVLRKWRVTDFLRRHGYEMRLTETGEIHVRCPRCYDSKYRLYINPQSKNWVCHNCGGKGRSAINFVKWVLHCEDDYAVRVIVESADAIDLSDLQDNDIEKEPLRTSEQEEVSWPEGFRELKMPPDARSEPYWNYLVSRNLTTTMVREYGMGFCRRGSYRGRIIIPITVFGVRRGWVGRRIDSLERKKYLNPPGVHTGQLLFNIDTVIASGSDTVVLMEGMFDVFRINKLAVCTFGKKISRNQMRILRKAGFRKWIFCYDGDALVDAQHMAEIVPFRVETFRAKLPAQYDPGNAPQLILSRAIRDAESWSPMGGKVTYDDATFT